ncbi:MAG: hypothetical protein ACKVJU_19210 [Verrucomicrobiales bacterium]
MSWIYGLRRLKRKEYYEVDVTPVRFGPIGLSDARGAGYEDVDGVRRQIVEKICNGEIQSIRYPICFLSITIAVEIPDEELIEHFEKNKRWFESEVIDLISHLGSS